MMKSRAEAAVEQYKTPQNLNTRITLHEKYSVNKESFSDWLFSQYRFFDGMSLLEVGCGNGSAWKGRLETLPSFSRFVLTDFSEGMVSAARETLGHGGTPEYTTADVQALPFENESFDAVIANMMLYHVPNLHAGLSEIARVLKRGGVFYAATFGENGIAAFVADMLKPYGCDFTQNTNFTLQNGESALLKHFGKVRRVLREDALLITDAGDLADYILSLSGLYVASELGRDELVEIVNAKMTDGQLRIPKEYGMFICE